MNSKSPLSKPDSLGIFDAVIIGAGVIGCAIARRLTLDGWAVIVLEKAADVLDGASKANSAILHTGFDAPVGSVEQKCLAEGYAEYLEVHQSLGLPLDEAGALVIAWNDDEVARLPDLIAQAEANGVNDTILLSGRQTRGLEPELSSSVRAAFRVPREYLIDPWSAPHAYLRQAIENGGKLATNCEVVAGDFDGKDWNILTTQGKVTSKVVITAAGLFGDQVDRLLTGVADFTIKPRKGQFIVFDKPAARLTQHILLPVPNPVTKGIVVCRTVFGNLLVGPTAEEQTDRENAMLDPATLDRLRQRGIEILPALSGIEVTSAYAGLRPASEHKDYQITLRAEMNYVSVGGIRSTGLSSALGTARHVQRLCAPILDRTPLSDPHITPARNLAEALPRDWSGPDNGGIVCHCEKVTRADIEAALAGPLPACSLAGLKRRTRVTMGRCQGNWCAATLARITEGRLPVPMSGRTS